MDKNKSYALFLKQLENLIQTESDFIANLANFSALYMQTFTPHWVGFYLAKDKELVLGPFQGPVACTRIAYGTGVCGTAWKDNTTLIVDNVHEFQGHIACSALSNSEIVIPIVHDGRLVGVLDIDSENYSQFDNMDQQFLEKAVEIISAQIN